MFSIHGESRPCRQMNCSLVILNENFSWNSVPSSTSPSDWAARALLPRLCSFFFFSYLTSCQDAQCLYWILILSCRSRSRWSRSASMAQVTGQSSLGCEKKGNNLVKCTAKMRSLQRVYLILSCWSYHYHGRSQLFLENKAACWRISTIHSAIWERKVIEVSWSAADFPSCAGTVTVCEGNLYPHIGLPFARCATHR